MTVEEKKDIISKLLGSDGKFSGMKFSRFSKDASHKAEMLMEGFRTIQEAVYCITNNTSPNICSCGNTSSFISISRGYGDYCSKKCLANRDKSKDIINVKDYSVIEKNKFFVLYTTEDVVNVLRNILIGSTGKINSQVSLEDLALKDISLYKSLLFYTSFLLPHSKLNERFYCIENNLSSPPVCEVCGDNRRFSTYTRGYVRTCGKPKCSANQIGRVEKMLNTKDNKSPNWRDEWKEKFKLTNIERYGVKYPMQNKEIRDKCESTNIQRYGESHNEIRIAKAFKSHLKNTGYPTPLP